MTQKFTKKYLLHDTPFPLPYHLQPCADLSIAINTKTERQQFFAVTASLKSGFYKSFFFVKKPKKSKIWTFGIFSFFL